MTHRPLEGVRVVDFGHLVRAEVHVQNWTNNAYHPAGLRSWLAWIGWEGLLQEIIRLVGFCQEGRLAESAQNRGQRHASTPRLRDVGADLLDRIVALLDWEALEKASQLVKIALSDVRILFHPGPPRPYG